MVTCGLLGDADHSSVAQTERFVQVRVEYQVLNDRNDSSSSSLVWIRVRCTTKI